MAAIRAQHIEESYAVEGLQHLTAMQSYAIVKASKIRHRLPNYVLRIFLILRTITKPPWIERYFLVAASIWAQRQWRNRNNGYMNFPRLEGSKYSQGTP